MKQGFVVYHVSISFIINLFKHSVPGSTTRQMFPCSL